MQLMFFITPIIWHPEIISRNEFIYKLNPIYHWINLLRDPLIGKNDLTNSFYISVIVLLLLFSLSIYFTGKFKNKIFYWL